MWKHVVISAACLVAASRAAVARPVTIDVDAHEMSRRLIRAHLVIPAKPGKLVVRYARWMPGEHGPTGPIEGMSNLVFTVGGKPIAWQRDPVDLFAFKLDVPAGATEVAADVEYVLPDAGMFSGGATATESLGIVSWNQVALFPDGVSSDAQRIKASLRLPHGWKFGTALPVTSSAGDRLDIPETSLTTLIDSPVLAGMHVREISLSETAPKARIVIAADSEEALAVPDDIVAGYRKLVAEAGALFGARHYHSYTFLLTLSDTVAHFGLEHHESSDDRTNERVFVDDDATVRHRTGYLLAHEYVHSWNGKFRRPAGLQPGHFEVPMQGDLLWVYEGLTEYLGLVLTARAGLDTPAHVREVFAIDAAQLASASGRQWRPLVDTAIAAQQLYGDTGWWSRTRGVDYYPEGAEFWLEVDSIIRARSHGAKSIDDFCKAFYGIKDNAVEVVPYTLDDVIATLNGVVPYDWKGLIEKRVYSVRAKAPVEGIEAAGWKLAYTATKPDVQKAAESVHKSISERFSVGIVVDEHQMIDDVTPGSPADKAGISPAMKIVAVNGRVFTPERFADGITRSKTHPGMELLVQHGDNFLPMKLDLRGGPRYPELQHGSGDDLLSAIFAAKTH